MKILSSSVIGFRIIEFLVDDFTQFSFPKFIIKNNNIILKISSYFINNNIITINLADEIDFKLDCILFYNNLIYSKCSYIKLFSSKEFNKRFYTTENLGLNYKRHCSEFKVWSPAATSVNLLLYKNGDTFFNDVPRKFPMSKSVGVWSTSINEDLKGLFYTYEVNVLGAVNETVDPYAKSVGINGLRGAIINLDETNPPDFENDLSPNNISNFTDAIIYEISIRDFTINPNSGVFNRGKFLGLSEENTRTVQNEPTGIGYIKSLGITHVQIMPMFDFSYKSIDEKNPLQYNWGYDPQNYNVPEGNYSTNPYLPLNRIIELKKMIHEFHKNGICVNMDVVYNHLYHEKENCFEKIFPDYYFRYNDNETLSNGSECGNDTASEKLMMRKFIIDSVLYWATEYHIDGFRFDLWEFTMWIL